MSQKEQKHTTAEPFHEQGSFTDGPLTDDPAADGPFTGDPFTDSPFTDGAFTDGASANRSLNREPFLQATASREVPGAGVQDMPGEAEEDLPVEEAFARLEQLIRRMESEDISLEDSFACYEQGIRLVRYCNERIDRVEKKVQILRGEGFSQSPPDSREG